ncbi:MAG: outer membrane protein assembly factor BamE [Burkholderiales bacterium]
MIRRRRRATQRFRLLAAAVLAAALAGCAQTTQPFENFMPLITQFGVYKLDINQGNYISQDMVDKLKVGQTKQQVRVVLGTPLIVSAFRDNRWDYVYEFQRNGRVREHRQFTVYFKDDALARWEGDEMPMSVQELNRTAGTRSLPEDPYGQDAGIVGKIIDFFRRIGDPGASPAP